MPLPTKGDPLSFSVDTHLFRELGALLVGRDSTALVELVKNSYDADATRVTVYGENLEDQGRGLIRVVDNGHGMDGDDFIKGFLRIASRMKDLGNHRSRYFRRRFTGQKGIGRLAAHKLAKSLIVESIKGDPTKVKSNRSVRAEIDWDQIESVETLDMIPRNAIRIEETQLRTPQRPGTTVTLLGLRKPWDSEHDLEPFVSEIRFIEPPPLFSEKLGPDIISGQSLFAVPTIRVPGEKDRGFSVHLKGEFHSGDEIWQTLAARANWLIDIDAGFKDPEHVHFGIFPTNRSIEKEDKYSGAKPLMAKVPHPDPKNGPHFHGRIFVLEGRVEDSKVTRWARSNSGVRIYLEGFRVLPYGIPGDDWLELDRDYATRTEVKSDLRFGAMLQLEREGAVSEDADPKGLLILPNRSYVGGIFLTTDKSPSLQMLINREGFVPDRGMRIVREITREIIDVCTRLRASTSESWRRSEKGKRNKESEAGTEQTTENRSARLMRRKIEESLLEAKRLASDVRASLSAGKKDLASEKIDLLVEHTAGAQSLFRELFLDEPMLWVLASVGTRMTSLIHEINSLVGSVKGIEALAQSILEDPSVLESRHRKILSRLIKSARDVRHSVERHAAYLGGSVALDARRRRSRQSLAKQFDDALRVMEGAAKRREIRVHNRISKDLKSPLAFPAEMLSVFTNLLSNAIKAAGKGGTICARATERKDGTIRLVIENTGRKVGLKQSERWFQPFETTTYGSSLDPVLGQGMGMGLPLTRAMLEGMGAEVKFTEPTEEFSTAIEILFPR